MAATLIDYIVLFSYLATLLLIPPTFKLMNSSASFAILFILPIFFYHLVCEAVFNGKSVGKFAMRTRVMRTDGSPPSLGDLLLRWIFRSLDSLFFWSVGLLSVIFTEKGQRIGDLAAGTLVVKDSTPPSIETLWAEPDPDHRITFDEAQWLSDQEVEMLREALDRSKNSTVPIERLLAKIKERTGLRSKWGSVAIARTLIHDHDVLFREGRTV